MSLIVPPGYGLASFILSGSQGTAPYVTTMGFDLGEYGGDFVEAADSAFLAYSTGIMPITSDQFTLERVSLFVGNDGPSGSVDSTEDPVQGSRDQQFTPSAMSLIVRKVTNDLGRQGRGRMFLPGVLAEGDVDEAGQVETASLSTYQDALADFIAFLVDPSPSPPLPAVLLHSDGPDVPGPTPIIALTVAPIVGWIRGRIR